MRKVFITSIVAASLAMAGAASATDWGFGAGGFAGGLSGVGSSTSGAGNLSGAFQFGSSTASASSESFGRAESAFGVGIGTLPDGTNASASYGNFAGGMVASGSMSTASTTANGNGFSGAGSIGAGFGQTSLSGAALGIGGYVTTGN